MKKIFAKLHLWLSLPFGIVITIMCITGAILIFEKEITQLINPEQFYVKEAKSSVLPIEQLIPLVKKQLPDTTVISSVTVPSESNLNYAFSIKSTQRVTLMVDPYTGEIMATVSQAQNGFFPTVRGLHRWLLVETKRDQFSWGKMVTGISTLLFVIILITGIVIWIPKSYRMIINRLSIHWKKGNYRFFYDLHLAGGMYAAIFLFIFCLTGLTWSFEWYRNGFYKTFGAEISQNQSNGNASSTERDKSAKREFRGVSYGDEKRDRRGSSEFKGERQHRRNHEEEGTNVKSNNSHRPQDENSKTAEFVPQEMNHPTDEFHGHDHPLRITNPYRIWALVVDSLKLSNPDFYAITVEESSASVANDKFSTRAVDKYSFNPYNGQITDVKYYKDSENAMKLRGTIYRLHVGNWGGQFTRILSFVACLIGASLPLTGYYMYIKKLRMRRRNRKN